MSDQFVMARDLRSLKDMFATINEPPQLKGNDIFLESSPNI
jgi:hypothetical protein